MTNQDDTNKNMKEAVDSGRNRKLKKVEDIVPVLVQCSKSIVGRKPILTKDSRFILCGCGSAVNIYHRRTGLLEATFRGHRSNVINLFVDETNPLQIISASASGEILFWEYADRTVQQSFQLPFEPLFVYPTPKEPMTVYCLTKGKDNDAHVVRVNLKRVDHQQMLSIVTVSKSMAISGDGKSVAVHSKNSVICNYGGREIVLAAADKPTCCVTFHPSGRILAYGDADGRIFIWYGLPEEPKFVQLHWHSQKISDLEFSADGNYLFSGGMESTLVTWHLESQEPTFLPRLGSPIQYISRSENGQHLCVALANNVVKVLRIADMELVSAIQGLAPVSDVACGLAYDPRTGSVVLNSSPHGTVQFYQPRWNKVALTLDVVGENLVSSVVDRPVFPTSVRCVAFSCDGTWMATVDLQKNNLLPEEWKLKFWKYSSDVTNYLLSTVADVSPDQFVRRVVFQPTATGRCLAVSTGQDGKFRVWGTRITDPGQETESQSWFCQSVGKLKSTSCSEVCFSEDGSLLAALFDEITLWDIDPLVMRVTFGACNLAERIVNMAFGFKESSIYLIGHTAHFMLVWNLLTYETVWCVQANVELLVTDPWSKYFAAIVLDQTSSNLSVHLFGPDSHQPVGSCLDVGTGAALSSAIFLPRSSSPDEKDDGKSVWQRTGDLCCLFMDSSIKLLTLSDPFQVADNQRKTDGLTLEEDVFRDLLGLRKAAEHKKRDDLPKLQPSQSNVFQMMMSTPSHVLPSVNAMFHAFAKSILGRSERVGAVEDREEDSSDSDIDKDAEKSDEEEPSEVGQSLGSAAVKEAGSHASKAIENDDSAKLKVHEYDFSFIENVFANYR